MAAKGGSSEESHEQEPTEQEAKISEYRISKHRRQLMVRIPSTISKIMDIEKGDTLRFHIDNPQSKSRTLRKLTITHILRHKVKE